MTDTVSSEVRPAHRTLVGLRLKQLVLVFGAVYLGMVALTNLVNVASQVSGSHWVFLNSENIQYMATIVKVYGWPMWFDELAAFGAACVEGFGAILFVRALIRFKGAQIGLSAVYLALAWNMGVWFAFIVGTEFFVAYTSESPFRELMGLGLLMTILVTVVPDQVPSTGAEIRADSGA